MAKKLYIIDGHAQIYAAFYAPMQQALTAPNGEPTKAVFVFTTILLKLLKEQQPDMVVMTLDSAGSTFRHEMYPAYKANRPPMPEELIGQIHRIEEILRAMHIPILRKDGFEADDIIGTLADMAAKKGHEVYICSKDKDLEQLIEEKVFVFDPRKGIVTDAEGLYAQKGIHPGQVIDILALMGDTSDNIPGVADVGPKTAQQWIQKYGSLAGLLEHQDEIKGKRGENLRAGLEQLKLSRKLVTINRAVPLEFDWNDFPLKSFDRQALEGVFGQLGFRKLIHQLDDLVPTATGSVSAEGGLFPADSAEGGGATQPMEAVAIEANYQLVDTAEAFDEFLAELKKGKSFAVDTETTGTNPVAAELVGLSFSWQEGTGYYLPVKVPLGQPSLDRTETLGQLKPILEDPKIAKTGQNIKYDMVILRRAGIELAGMDFDTMVASYVLNSARTQHNMDSLAWDYLGHETIKLESLIGKGKNQLTFDMVDTQTAADYAAEDADITWRLRQFLEKQFTDDERRQLFRQVEMPLIEVLAEMEYNGVALDVPWLKKLSTKLTQRCEELVEEIHKEAGTVFNVDSPKQLGQVLFEQIGLKVVKKTKTGPSTDQEVLETLSWQHPVPKLMLEYRTLSKLKNTYVDKLPSMICVDTGRIHASFNQSITATGRLSSSNPNLQNIPIRTDLGQEIRRAFVAGDKDNVILAADYSQIELRLLAHFSRDEGLLQAFESGQDIHRFVAAQVFSVDLDEVDTAQRGKAKAVNFGIIYGQTPFGLSRGIGIPVEEARRFIDDYFERYPRIQEFMEKVIVQAKQEGYVKTILGRRRVLPEINSQTVNRRKLAERMAVNTVVQGSAADLIKVAMINLHRRIQSETLDMKMILQVHDELVFEVPQANAESYSEIVREEMAAAIKLDVPIIVDVNSGKNWLEAK
jgi:DNA polymerase I